jgi:hypothetical protein
MTHLALRLMARSEARNTHRHAIRLTSRSKAMTHLALCLTVRSEARNIHHHALHLTTRLEAMDHLALRLTARSEASVITEISSAHGYNNSASSNSDEVIHGPELILQHSKKVKNYTK